MNQSYFFLMHITGWVLVTLSLFSCESEAKKAISIPVKNIPAKKMVDSTLVLKDSIRLVPIDSIKKSIPIKKNIPWSHRVVNAVVYKDTNQGNFVKIYTEAYAVVGHKSKLKKLKAYNDYAAEMWKRTKTETQFPMHLGNGHLMLYWLSPTQKTEIGDSIWTYGNYIYGDGINAVLTQELELYIDSKIPITDFMADIPFEPNYSNPIPGCYYIKLKAFEGAEISRISQKLRKQKGLISIRNQLYTAEPVPLD